MENEFCTVCGFNLSMHERKVVGGESVEVCPKLAAVPNDRQVGKEDYADGGYGHGGKIQHWDFAATNNFDYFQGQITKYVTRWRGKGGLKDLQKAQHFLEKYVDLVKKGVVK